MHLRFDNSFYYRKCLWKNSPPAEYMQIRAFEESHEHRMSERLELLLNSRFRLTSLDNLSTVLVFVFHLLKYHPEIQIISWISEEESSSLPMETDRESNSIQETEKLEENKQQSQEDKVPDSSENSVVQPVAKVANKGKKRKKPKDSTAPRHPLTGYVRFLNDRRENVRSENPALSFAEITKLLASEWSNLPSDKKQHYLDAAEQDRERYTREYNAYKQTEAYKLFTAQQNEKKKKENKEDPKNVLNNNSAPPKENNADLDLSNFDIPIFTEEFLDHNKTRDSELRQLRKSNTDFEQQNSILQKHIENMKTAISKLENEISQQEKNNAVLQRHLDHLRVTLTDGFSNIKLPGMREKASLQNIDSYMTNLHSILLENSTNDVDLLKTVREIVGRLEFNG